MEQLSNLLKEASFLIYQFFLRTFQSNSLINLRILLLLEVSELIEFFEEVIDLILKFFFSDDITAVCRYLLSGFFIKELDLFIMILNPSLRRILICFKNIDPDLKLIEISLAR